MFKVFITLQGKIIKHKEMGKLGLTEIILILLVVVLLFGGRKIPELMKGIGQGMKEFKKASKFDPAEETKDLSPKDKF